MGLKYINKALNLPVSASWLALLAQTVSNIHSPIVASSASCLNLRSCSTRCRSLRAASVPRRRNYLLFVEVGERHRSERRHGLKRTDFLPLPCAARITAAVCGSNFRRMRTGCGWSRQRRTHECFKGTVRAPITTTTSNHSRIKT